MSKRELINRIMDLNRSARRDFLQSFTENDLADYLRQLESIDPATMTVEPMESASQN